MDKQREYEGKDLQEAIQAASASLEIPEGDLHYEIIEQGRRGVFGLGARSVRIRVKPPIESLTDAEIRPGSRRRGRGERRRGGSKKPGGPLKPEASEQAPPAQPRREPAAKAPPAPVDARPPSEEQQKVLDTLRRILELMGLDVTVSPGAQQGNGFVLDLSGTDQKRLMEKNGELLLALQLLLNRMARRTWPEVGRIHLSSNGERRRRDDELVELAREVAQQVASTGRTKKLHPMNAYERRLVHLTVREFGGLSSSSDGNGSLKRVRISKIKNQL